MKIELTIKTTYLPQWGVFEGIRELIQNGKDAETEFSAPLTVRHKADTNTLVIENEGATLPHEALLFGHSTKADRSDLIGKFGEGLKLGTLALVRAGYNVKIRSGSEVWEPAIQRSEKFDADVLVFNINIGRQPKNRVQVEVSNITAEEWDLLKQHFLFLNKSKEEDRINTPYGALLLRPQDVGKVFVKGIFVEQEPKLQYGYDLTKDVTIDRDRKMVARWELEWRTRLIWTNSLSTHGALASNYLKMIYEGAADVKDVDENTAKQLPENVKTQAVADFKERYGEDAIPVDNMADSKDVAHLGKNGVIVNKSLKSILQSILGSTEQIKADLENEVKHHYSWNDLSAEEKKNLEEAIALVNKVAPIALSDVDVVDFRSETTLGLIKDGRMLLAKNKLADREMTLETLVHEVAHRCGADGSHQHVAAIERIWSGIVASFRNLFRN
jgi:hypothetical protein